VNISIANPRGSRVNVSFTGFYAKFVYLKEMSNEKVGGSGVTSALGTWYGGVVRGVLLSFDEAAILYRDFNSALSSKQNIIVFAANNSM
jgi:hypothetical protein